ncbi:MAG: hypothetical protein PHE50_07530 [Dehalococcoidales bacterium]|nr:hypothetical protein [Dehalococcoidales bacterium]
MNRVYPLAVNTIEQITPEAAGYRVTSIVNSEAEENAMNTAIAYQAAFNEADLPLTDSFLNFPHARVGANGQLVIAAKAGDTLPPDFFKSFREVYGWNHSCWDARAVLQSSETKVHLMVTFSRYRKDGSKIGTFPSIWVITKQDGHWGIKMRSSYA